MTRIIITIEDASFPEEVLAAICKTAVRDALRQALVTGKQDVAREAEARAIETDISAKKQQLEQLRSPAVSVEIDSQSEGRK